MNAVRLPRSAAKMAARRSAVLANADPSMIELLESRVLLSHSPVATPNYMLYHKAGTAAPAASASIVGLTAAKVRKAYGIDATSFAGIVGDGTGQTIAIVDAYDAPTIAADLKAFDLAMGLSDPTLTIVKQANTPASGTTGWSVETSLDVEWAHVVAPKANILLVEAASASFANLYAAVDTARNTADVSVVSMSWGSTEASGSAGTYDSHFLTPAGHIPITFFASSGDNGAYNNGGTTKAVSYPAVSQNIVAVGGTFLTTDASGNYVSESGWGNGTSSGTSGGAGGGISTTVSKPTWQSSVTQSTTKRTVPDVAFLADPNSGVAVYDSYDNSASAPWEQVGGTSLAAPMWAGLMAIVDQGRVQNGLTTLDGSTQTLPLLYSLSSSDFHDITTGNNGFAAGVGYDLVTGRGTPIVNLLAPDLAGFSSTPKPAVPSFTINPTSVLAGTSATLTATATETGGTISGLSFYIDSNSNGIYNAGTDALVAAGTFSGSSYSASASTTGLSGTYTFFAVATDTTSQTATASATLTVTVPATPNPIIGSFTLSPTSVVIGTPTTFTAANVIDAGSTITAVKFYRDSDGTTGLNTATDTLVGTGTQVGTTWSISAATTGLAAGTYTFYAVATDAAAVSSAASSATLAVTSQTATTGVLAGWSVTGQTKFGTQGLKAATVANVTNSTGLTRGAGLKITGSSASNAWGATNFSSTSAAGITAGDTVTFGLTVAAGKTVSLTAIDLNYRRSSTGSNSGLWQYQLNGGTWTTFADVASEFSSTSSTGAAMTTLSTTGVAGLQNLVAGTVVNIRLTPYGATRTGGSWYIYDKTGNDLAITGSTLSSAVVTKFSTATVASDDPSIMVNTPAAPTSSADTGAGSDPIAVDLPPAPATHAKAGESKLSHADSIGHLHLTAAHARHAASVFGSSVITDECALDSLSAM